MFVDIREPDEINKLKQQIEGACVTLLIRRPSVDSIIIGNDSDDQVDTMDYDYYFVNNKPISHIENEFVELIKVIINSN